jgi:hypothetical protein
VPYDRTIKWGDIGGARGLKSNGKTFFPQYRHTNRKILKVLLDAE